MIIHYCDFCHTEGKLIKGLISITDQVWNDKKQYEICRTCFDRTRDYLAKCVWRKG